MTKYDVAIIGGGILGTTISYWLSALTNLKICVIDKERHVSMHASGRNTGVVHSPFYIDPKKKKQLAKFALISHDLWKTLANKNNIPWLEVGTIKVSINEQQHKTLEKYIEWGIENGIHESKLQLLNSKQISKKEQNVHCYSGIYCKRDVSTDYGLLTRTVQKYSEKCGTKFIFTRNVKNIVNKSEYAQLIFSNNYNITANFVINCSGSNSLTVAKKFGVADKYSALHFRGEYWIAEKPYDNLVNTNIYSVAKFSDYPFLDPHWIKRSDGTTVVGPNAIPVLTSETYNGYINNYNDLIHELPRLLNKNTIKLIFSSDFLSLISNELISSISKTVMINRIKQFIPSIGPRHFIKRGVSGIRTPIIDTNGKFVKNILELYGDNSLHILNYNSPGATGAPAYSASIIQKLYKRGFLNIKRIKNTIWNYDNIIN